METIEIDRAELSALIERIEEAIEHDLALSVDDMQLLLSVITTLCTVQSQLEQDDVTLHKLRKLLGMVRQSEQRRTTSGKSNSKKHKQGQPRKRNKRTTSTPKKEYHLMNTYHKGDVCPCCARGKLYKYEPAKLLRITGHARYEATLHMVERLRCNGCQEVYTAHLPDSVLADGDANQMYGYSARSIMAIDKFYSGTPYHHQENLADLFGFSISASTIFDQCEMVANDVMPVFYEMERYAANALRFSIDDTHNRILEQQPELRDKRNGNGKQLRTGVYSSGLIAENENHEVILFKTSLGHAGEHLDDILKKRDTNLLAPLVMSDALSSNLITEIMIKACYCNAHARRQFYDLESQYPDEIAWVLDTYGKIWEHEAIIREKQMDDEARLSYHQQHSLPVMQSLYDWARSRQQADDFEEHSTLGKAIRYFSKHYEKLIMFCREPGALIDNNRMEEKLKILIRGRKLAHFYKTTIGASVANVLISIIATTAQAGENIYDYLTALQRYRKQVAIAPTDWLPWAYRNTLANLAKYTFDAGGSTLCDTS